MRWIALALLVGCGSDGGKTLAFGLDAGAFPRASWPSVVVYVPAGFHLEKPVHVVIWLRGLHNCAENVLRAEDGECTPGGGKRDAFHLAAQLEAAHRNVLLIVPELEYDSGSSDPGNLANPGGLRAFLAETLRDLGPTLGPLTVEDLAPLVIAAHSAAWHSTSAILQAGDLPISEVFALDALYDGIPAFVAWIMGDLNDYVRVPPDRRFADIYTDETAASSINFAETAENDWVPDPQLVFDDDTPDDVPDDDLRVGLVFKRSPLNHNDVARVWFQRLLATSRLP